jgi:hypothetical protein
VRGASGKGKGRGDKGEDGEREIGKKARRMKGQWKEEVWGKGAREGRRWVEGWNLRGVG